MTIFGKRLSEYVEFCKPFLALIIAVGIARLALSFAGVPNQTAKWLSITAVAWFGVLYYAVRVHTTGFGSYKHLLPICVLQSVAAQLIIVPGIIIAIVTDTDNIYSAPEFSFGGDGKTWLHVGAHLVLATTIGPLISWLIGCIVMFATRKLFTRGKDTIAASRA
jgi:hypothetical protein